MRRVALIGLLALAGCSEPPMKNDAIILEIAKCKKAGLEAVEVHDNFFSSPMQITAIQCQQPYRPQ